MAGILESLKRATPKANVSRGSGSVFEQLKGQLEREAQTSREARLPGEEILPADLQPQPTEPVLEAPIEPETILESPELHVEEPEEVTPEGLERLKLDEGERLSTYIDSVGVPTIGVGFNLNEPANAAIFKRVTGFTVDEAGKPGFKITKEQSSKLLAYTVKRAESEASSVFPNINELPEDVQDALVNFTFNLGQTKANQFNETRAAIAAKDGKRAAALLRKSLWYRQVKGRGERIASILEKSLRPDSISSEDSGESDVEVFEDDTGTLFRKNADGSYTRLIEG